MDRLRTRMTLFPRHPHHPPSHRDHQPAQLQLPNMNGEFSIRDLDFPDGEDDTNDPDYEPQPSEFGASDSDISMLSAGQATTISTDISIPSAIPTDAQSIADVSDIFPDDSVSQRDLKLAAQTKRYQVPPSEASETPSIVSFHSSGQQQNFSFSPFS